MNHDDFEQKLRHQPLRQVPAEWRVEILAVAGRGSRVAGRELQRLRPSFLSTLNSQLSTIFWPHPAAWAGLAALWIFIFAMNFTLHDNAPVMVEKYSPPTTEVIVEVRQQQRLLAELIGSREVREADRSKSLMPRPRSERNFEIMMA